MKKLLYSLIFTTLLVLLPTEIYAQSAGINFSLGFPRGNFYANNKRTGLGGSIEALLIQAPAGGMNFGIGANLGYYNFGTETRRAYFSTTIPDVSVDVDRSYNLMNYHLLMRLSTNNTLLRPYVDLLLGGSYLYTSTTVRNEMSGEEVTSSTNFDDFAWSYGIGAGFVFKIYDSKEENAFGPIYLDIKARYLVGTEAEYIKQGGVTVDDVNGKVSYHVTVSETDLLTVHVGVAIPLNFKNLSNL